MLLKGPVQTAPNYHPAGETRRSHRHTSYKWFIFACQAVSAAHLSSALLVVVGVWPPPSLRVLPLSEVGSPPSRATEQTRLWLRDVNAGRELHIAAANCSTRTGADSFLPQGPDQSGSSHQEHVSSIYRQWCLFFLSFFFFSFKPFNKSVRVFWCVLVG